MCLVLNNLDFYLYQSSVFKERRAKIAVFNRSFPLPECKIESVMLTMKVNSYQTHHRNIHYFKDWLEFRPSTSYEDNKVIYQNRIWELRIKE